MNRTFRSIHQAATCIICILYMTSFLGCTKIYPMALEQKPEKLDLSTKSLGLFTLKTSNQYKPSYEPDVEFITITSKENKEDVIFQVKKPHKKESKNFLEYLISIDLAPGTYTIGNISGHSNNILTIGAFVFPADADFELPPDSVVYLGHLYMVNRKRNEGEKRSGSIFPLVDQAASGYGGGTFDITIIDRSEEDVPLFEQTYPELEKYIINNSIMTR
jgi:hypothetical protein